MAISIDTPTMALLSLPFVSEHRQHDHRDEPSAQNAASVWRAEAGRAIARAAAGFSSADRRMGGRRNRSIRGNSHVN
jgi:hypothetical protein